MDEGNHNDEGTQRQMASAYLSRRSSRNSLRDDVLQTTQEMEEDQRNGSIGWELQPSSSRSHSLPSNGKDTPPLSTSSRYSEKSGTLQCMPSGQSLRDAQLTESSAGTSMSSSSSVSDSSDYPAPASNGRPINFGVVVPGVYRSSYPKPEDYGFLRNLGLKTVMYDNPQLLI